MSSEARAFAQEALAEARLPIMSHPQTEAVRLSSLCESIMQKANDLMDAKGRTPIASFARLEELVSGAIHR